MITKVCKKCGKPIYDEEYFVNVNSDDGFYFHERCLAKANFRKNSIGYMKNNSRCYMPIWYTNNELVEIASDLMKEKREEQLKEEKNNV